MLPPPSGHNALIRKDVNYKDFTFSVFGTCVSRDIVTALGSRVDRFVQDVSPISVSCKSLLPKGKKLSEENIKNILLDHKLSHFLVRNIILDMNKDVYSYLFAEKSDWLILDMGCLRYKMFMCRDDCVGVTECHINRLNYNYDKNAYYFVSVLDMDETSFNKHMEEYLDSIRRNINEERIIVVEVYLANEYIGTDHKGLYEFQVEIKKHNNEIRRGYDYLKQRLRRAHFVPFIDNNLGDENHKWGKYPLHYVPEYYEYGAEVIKLIINHLPKEQEVVCIDTLQNYYNERIKIKYLSSVASV